MDKKLCEVIPPSQIFVYLKPNTILNCIIFVSKLWNKEAMKNNVWKSCCQDIVGPYYFNGMDTKNRYNKYMKSYYLLYKQLIIENKYIGTYKLGPGHGKKGTTHNIVIWRYCGKITYLKHLMTKLKDTKKSIISNERRFKTFNKYLDILSKITDEKISGNVEEWGGHQTHKVKDLKKSAQIVINESHEQLLYLKPLVIKAEQFVNKFLDKNNDIQFYYIEGLDEMKKLLIEFNKNLDIKYEYKNEQRQKFMDAVFGDNNDSKDSKTNDKQTYDGWLKYGLQELKGHRNYFAISMREESVDVHWMNYIKELKGKEYSEYDEIINEYPLRCMITEAGYWDSGTDWNVTCGIILIIGGIAKFTQYVSIGGWIDAWNDNDEDEESPKYHIDKLEKVFKLKYSIEGKPHPYRGKYGNKPDHVLGIKGWYLECDNREYYSVYHPGPQRKIPKQVQ